MLRTVNYDGKALKPNEVLVPFLKDSLFISTNVTSAENIVYVPVSNAGKRVKAVLMAVDKNDEALQSAYAAVLKAAGYTGAEFEEKMQFKHNAANKAVNRMEALLKALLTGEEVEIKAKNTKRTEGYRKEAEKILEDIMKLL